MSLNRPVFLGTLGTFSRQESEQLLPSGGSTPYSSTAMLNGMSISHNQTLSICLPALPRALSRTYNVALREESWEASVKSQGQLRRRLGNARLPWVRLATLSENKEYMEERQTSTH